MFDKESLIEKSKNVFPALYLLSLIFISIFGILYGKNGFYPASVTSLIISIIVIIFTGLYYMAYYEDTEETKKAYEFYYDMTEFNSITLTLAEDSSREFYDTDDEKLKNYMMDEEYFNHQSLSDVLKTFNNIIMPNTLIMANPALDSFYSLYLFRITAIDEQKANKLDDMLTKDGVNAIHDCTGTGYLNITKLMHKILSISTIDFHTTLSYDESIESHKIVVIKNSEEYNDYMGFLNINEIGDENEQTVHKGDIQ